MSATHAPRFAVFSDQPSKACIATFGGPCPQWAVVIALPLDARQTKTIANGTPSLMILFDRDGAEARAVEALFNDMRARGRITGIDEHKLKALDAWLRSNSRCAGEPVATLIAAGCSAASIRISQPAFAVLPDGETEQEAA